MLFMSIISRLPHPMSVDVSGCSMANVLEDSAHIRLRALLPEQQILYPSHWSRLALVREVVPRACVTVQHGSSLDELPAIFATLAFKCVMRVARGAWAILEELSQGIQTEVALDILG